MNKDTFNKFCTNNYMPKPEKKAFWEYLEAKYGGKIPAHLDLTQEYRQFQAEATSHL